MIPVGIYIHVPFCAKKCPYCDFYSCGYSKFLAESYTKAVIRDIENFSGSTCIDTVYFGGGTPSLLPAECINDILDCIYKKFSIISPEITIEVNPCTADAEKLTAYNRYGINRLSVGVQSANDSELKFLGRKHNFEKAKNIILTAYDCGFKNISCDLMTGLPHQTSESLEFSIESLAELPINHISNYILKIESNTPFDSDEIKAKLPDDETVSDLYLFMVKKLSELGFIQYEISNFAKKGCESRHNLKYWQTQEYIGFGPSAHSFYNGRRYYYSPDLNSFIKSTPEMIITDDSPADDEEKIMLGLRLAKGINTDDFPDKKAHILTRAAAFEKAGLVEISKNNIRLTPRGFLVSNSIISEFL